MASVVCGWCGNRCHMTRSGKFKAISKGGYPEYYLVDAPYRCDGCDRLSVATWVTEGYPFELKSPETPEQEGPLPEDSQKWHPIPGHQREFRDVPERIAEAASEAWLCQAAKAYRGAVMLARAVVESTAKEKGFDTGNLYLKIEKLAEKNLIRKVVADQAHEIRHFGNSSAHGDLNELVTEEESEEVLYLMGEVLNEVFQAPAQGERLKSRRKAKLNGSK